ncbi:uncharacterized protein MELLADRAFT_71759 [Melampsora larici-populina 98AG31]|uniref:Carbohydrate esterase family 16 protein n=1 Tax=Melampsora larici-populina (strain 98AG31 / pathotype 3-4-7) TaxID=747676 RepID=F4RK90_MELLP|nr:uncharacterized protein MELLADRAFT_71759 [Melampsora larici-populina 98AG31]EGG07223.1 hypothetical protein MELLADRAFT_71759 [Melampsora larici-populina 98AG31]
MTPLEHAGVKKWTNGNKQKSEVLLSMLRALIKQYNDGLFSTFAKPQFKDSPDCGPKVYDISNIWNFIVTHPKKYGIKNLTDSCFTNNTVCHNVDEYFFWDYIHVTPKVQRLFGEDIYKFVSCNF